MLKRERTSTVAIRGNQEEQETEKLHRHSVDRLEHSEMSHLATPLKLPSTAAVHSVTVMGDGEADIAGTFRARGRIWCILYGINF